MTATTTAWPVKTREMHNHHMDSTIWDVFDHRDDDIIIASYAKSGTTWAQQIVAQLLLMVTMKHRYRKCRPGWICACRRVTSNYPLWPPRRTGDF